VHVRAFQDSNGDGIGDFVGLTQRLDYLQQLGIDTLWLMPFFPSPLRDDGYDIADYYSVHPSYGTLDDFKAFLNAAHQRNIRVIVELVLNHTSDQHPWFQESRKSLDNPRRDWYVWSDTDTRYCGVQDHLSIRAIKLGLGSCFKSIIGIAFQPPARQLRQSAVREETGT
jgi:maltose alpha-D-glucosyltransferase/alpha-amylase